MGGRSGWILTLGLILLVLAPGVGATSEAGHPSPVAPAGPIRALFLVHGINGEGSDLDPVNTSISRNPSNIYGRHIYSPDLYELALAQAPPDTSHSDIPIGPGNFTSDVSLSLPVGAGNVTDAGIIVTVADLSLARVLFEEMHAKLSPDRNWIVDLVVHSMGGLTSRAMIDYFTDNGTFRLDSGTVVIDKLIFIGTPLQGLDISKLQAQLTATVGRWNVELAQIDNTSARPWVLNNLSEPLPSRPARLTDPWATMPSESSPIISETIRLESPSM